MTGYDRKRLTLMTADPATVTMEIDLSGMGDWHPYRRFNLLGSAAIHYEFPAAFQAYWVRFLASIDTRATAQLTYD